LYWQLCDHKLFFSSLYILYSPLILQCCCSAERIWNIYQGIVCWRHNFYMVMLLAFEITVCNSGQNNLSVETFFCCFPERNCINTPFFSLTFLERQIWFLLTVAFFEFFFLHQADLQCSFEAHKCEFKSWSTMEEMLHSTSVCVQSHFRIPSPLFNYLTWVGCLLCGPDAWLPFFWLYKTCYKRRRISLCLCTHTRGGGARGSVLTRSLLRLDLRWGKTRCVVARLLS